MRRKEVSADLSRVLRRAIPGDPAQSVHLYLADCGSEGRRSWLRALDTIEQLHPRAVVAGPKDPSGSRRPALLGEPPAYPPRLPDAPPAPPTPPVSYAVFQATRL